MIERVSDNCVKYVSKQMQSIVIKVEDCERC